MSKKVFIVGVPRSGTTLAANMIGSHESISCGPETHFFRRTTRSQRKRAIKREDWVEESVKLVQGLEHYGKVYSNYGLSKKSVKRYIKENGPNEGALLASITNNYAERKNKRVWAEKTPRHIKHLGEIREIYPNAYIIGVVRDPRDTVMSMYRANFMHKEIVKNSIEWMNIMEDYETFKSEDDKCKSIKYENLVLETKNTLKNICKFLKLKWSSKMLRYYKQEDNLKLPGEEWKKKYKNPVDQTNVEKWKNMKRDDRILIECICGSSGIEYGYEMEPEKLCGNIYIDAKDGLSNKELFKSKAIRGEYFGALTYDDLWQMNSETTYIATIPEWSKRRVKKLKRY